MLIQPLYPVFDSFLLELIQVVDILADADKSKSVINCKDEEGWAPLHSAASIGNKQIVEILLSKGD